MQVFRPELFSQRVLALTFFIPYFQNLEPPLSQPVQDDLPSLEESSLESSAPVTARYIPLAGGSPSSSSQPSGGLQQQSSPSQQLINDDEPLVSAAASPADNTVVMAEEGVGGGDADLRNEDQARPPSSGRASVSRIPLPVSSSSGGDTARPSSRTSVTSSEPAPPPTTTTSTRPDDQSAEITTPRKKSLLARPPIAAKPQSPMSKLRASSEPPPAVVAATLGGAVSAAASGIPVPVLSGGEPTSLPPLATQQTNSDSPMPELLSLRDRLKLFEKVSNHFNYRLFFKYCVFSQEFSKVCHLS